MNKEKTHFIITAGGIGTRMNTAIPKQFIMLNEAPVIAHTINRLSLTRPHRITVVIPEKHIELWHSCAKHIPCFNSINVAFGGPERFHSVKSGLCFADKDEIIAIHDAVRPLFSLELIKQGINVAAISGTAVPVIKIADSVREINGALSKTIDRNNLRICQTPQFFHSKIILDAYRQSYKTEFTDDASVVESAGYTIRLIEGNSENIKITTQADLAFAKSVLETL